MVILGWNLGICSTRKSLFQRNFHHKWSGSLNVLLNLCPLPPLSIFWFGWPMKSRQTPRNPAPQGNWRQNGFSKKNPKVMPLWSLGFFAAVLVGSVLSSFNSALNSAATIFGLEIYKVYINKDGIFPGKQQINLNKRQVSTWTTLGPWKSGKIEHVLWKMNEFSLEKRPVQKEKVVFQPPFLGALLLFRGISEIDWDWMELFPWLWSKCGAKVDVSQTLQKGWVYRYVVHVGHGRIKDPTIGDIWEYTVWCSGAHTKM